MMLSGATERRREWPIIHVQNGVWFWRYQELHAHSHLAAIVL